MGTIMQTASLSAGKKSDGKIDSNGAGQLSQSHSRTIVSDFKQFNRKGASTENQYNSQSSSKNTDSNVASLVFRPRDSDAATTPFQHQ